MSTIYIHIDNTDAQNKIFVGTKAGAQAKAVEDKMAATIKRYVEKKVKQDFFVVPPKEGIPKGYVLILKITKLESDAKSAKCTISGEIVQYPRERNAKGEIGDISVAMALTASGSVSQTKDPVIEIVDALVEDIVAKAVPEMRRHFATRR